MYNKTFLYRALEPGCLYKVHVFWPEIYLLIHIYSSFLCHPTDVWTVKVPSGKVQCGFEQLSSCSMNIFPYCPGGSVTAVDCILLFVFLIIQSHPNYSGAMLCLVKCYLPGLWTIPKHRISFLFFVLSFIYRCTYYKQMGLRKEDGNIFLKKYYICSSIIHIMISRRYGEDWIYWATEHSLL